MVHQTEWQTLKVELNSLRAELSINNKENVNSPVGCDPIDLESPYYVGGVEEPVVLENIKADLEVSVDYYYLKFFLQNFGRSTYSPFVLSKLF